jgi:hypothetical protein
MGAHEDAEEFIRLVRANAQVANVAGGCDEGLIARAEAQLGLSLPPSYRDFLRQLGECDIAGVEFYGVWTRGDNPDALFGAVRTTLEARRTSAMPNSLVAFMSDGMGGLYVLDTASLDEEGEAPILVWEPGGSVPGSTLERVADSFGEFALRRTKHALAAW